MIDLDELRRLHEEGQAARVRSIRVWTESSLIAREKLDALMPALLDELESAREALAIGAEAKEALSRMRQRHTAPVDKRPIEISHDRAPILDHFAKARAHQSRFGET